MRMRVPPRGAKSHSRTPPATSCTLRRGVSPGRNIAHTRYCVGDIEVEVKPPAPPDAVPKIVLKAAIEMRAAQSQDGIGSPNGPEHPRLFETCADHRLAACFDDARADKQVLAAKLGIAHTLCISLEVVCLGANLVGYLETGGVDRP